VVDVVLYCEGKEDRVSETETLPVRLFCNTGPFHAAASDQSFCRFGQKGEGADWVDICFWVCISFGVLRYYTQLWSFTILYTALEFHDVHSFRKLVFGAHTFCDIGKT